MPKIMTIGWQKTKLLQKLSGLLFLAHPVEVIGSKCSYTLKWWKPNNDDYDSTHGFYTAKCGIYYKWFNWLSLPDTLAEAGSHGSELMVAIRAGHCIMCVYRLDADAHGQQK